MPISTILQRFTEFLMPEPELAHPDGPLFSIVIPVFRNAAKLERSIASVRPF